MSSFRMLALGCAAGASALFLVAASASAQGPAAPGASRATADSGAEMYLGYCAPCHGRKGTGDGPVAASLKTKPADLSRLTVRNGGTFPYERMGMVLSFGVVVPPHGSTDMPTWGSIFRAVGDEQSAQQRVAALSQFLETLQVRRR